MDCDEDSSLFKIIFESGLKILADTDSSSAKKSVLYYDKDLFLSRLLVCSILDEYIRSKLSPSTPIKCIDVIGSTGINGLLWKKLFDNETEVFINDNNVCTTDFIQKNARTNNLQVHVLNKDPSVVLHESGYSFIYIDCSSEASYYFDAAFRNISRNGVISFTTKDDPSLQGSNPGVARRRYGGKIARTSYSYELGIRLVLSSMVRSAAKFNKGLKVLCCYSTKGSFTIAVMVQKGPLEADRCLDEIQMLAHCTNCGERKFIHNCYCHVSPAKADFSCLCENKDLSFMGPVWAGDLFDVAFLEGMFNGHKPSDLQLKTLLAILLEEARCLSGEKEVLGDAKKIEPEAKRPRACLDVAPQFYYNLHQHKFPVDRLPSVTAVISALRHAGHRASKTHFCKLSVRTNASLSQLKDIICGIKPS